MKRIDPQPQSTDQSGLNQFSVVLVKISTICGLIDQGQL